MIAGVIVAVANSPEVREGAKKLATQGLAKVQKWWGERASRKALQAMEKPALKAKAKPDPKAKKPATKRRKATRKKAKE
jgi:hypothetical protein